MAEIITVQVGALATNCYLIGDSATGSCAVVDAGGDPVRIISAVQKAGWHVKYVLATHGHADHTGAVARLAVAFGCQFGAGRTDGELIANPQEWLTAVLPDFEQPPGIDLLFDGGESIGVGDVHIKVLATPGHTPGSVCFRVDDAVMTGDTLFRRSIGRYDLPGGDGDLEMESIRSVLLTLTDGFRVLPGHGPPSTIGEERRTNPFLR